MRALVYSQAATDPMPRHCRWCTPPTAGTARCGGSVTSSRSGCPVARSRRRSFCTSRRCSAASRRDLARSGVGVPAPLVAGRPAFGYPWSWSIVPWFDGRAGLGIPRAERAGWAMPLAEALLALHVAAPPDHPVNPVRGVPLARRAEAVAGRFESLRGRVPEVALDRAGHCGMLRSTAPPWSRAGRYGSTATFTPATSSPAARSSSRSSTSATSPAGDPAYDLAVAWLAFDPAGRSAFVAGRRRPL